MSYPVVSYVVTLDIKMNLSDPLNDTGFQCSKYITAKSKGGEWLTLYFLDPAQPDLDDSWNDSIKQGVKYCAEQDFPIVIDLLRNETTEWEVIAMGQPGKNGYAKCRLIFETATELAGEGE